MISYANKTEKMKATKILTITKGLNFETGKQKLDMEFVITLINK